LGEFHRIGFVEFFKGPVKRRFLAALKIVLSNFFRLKSSSRSAPATMYRCCVGLLIANAKEHSQAQKYQRSNAAVQSWEVKIMASALSKHYTIESKLKNRILSLNDGSELDFANAYLKDLSIERLRHILLYAETMRIKKKA